MMTGYLAPSDGEVLISGHDMMKEAEEAKQCIGDQLSAGNNHNMITDRTDLRQNMGT